MLAHTACREAEVAVNTILGKEDAMRYDANPSVIYTHPEVASVGLTEEEAKAQGIGYDVRKLSMRYAGRFLAENDGEDGILQDTRGQGKAQHTRRAHAGRRLFRGLSGARRC